MHRLLHGAPRKPDGEGLAAQPAGSDE